MDLLPRAENLGQRLQRAYRTALDEVQAPVQSNKGLARKLGITPVLASRLRKMIAVEDPVQALLVSPGEGPLQAVAAALEGLGATPEACSRMEAVLVAVRGFVASEAGDRRALEALLADHMEGGRSAFLAPRRQAVFRSLAEARGVHADLVIHTAFLTPLDEGGVEFSTLLGIHGLERSRALAEHSWQLQRRGEQAPEVQGNTIHHGHASGAAGSLEGLERFCFHPPAPLLLEELGEGQQQCSLGPTGFGPASRVDVLSLERDLARAASPEPEAGRMRAIGFTAQIPARRVVVEVVTPRDFLEGRAPALLEGSTSDLGPLDINSTEGRERLSTPAEPIEALGSGLDGLALEGLHLRRELLEEVFARLDQDPNEFHGWRVEVPFAYPWYQYFFGWEGRA